MSVVAAVRAASRAARSSAVARAASAPMAQKARTFISSSEDYGTHVFKGAVADEYLTKQGLPAGLLDDPKWTQTESDKVAAAVMEWANEKGASVFTHWFQPMGASGVRHGMSGQVQNAMFARGRAGGGMHNTRGRADALRAGVRAVRHLDTQRRAEDSHPQGAPRAARGARVWRGALFHLDAQARLRFAGVQTNLSCTSCPPIGSERAGWGASRG